MSSILCEIAGIIDDTKVVLNAGREALIRKGMRFVIYAETEHIFDSSGRDLGVLEIPKAEVEVTDVQDKMSIAEHTAIGEKELPIAYSLPDMFKPRVVKYRVPLNIAEGQKKVQSVDLSIKKGDKARSIS